MRVSLIILFLLLKGAGFTGSPDDEEWALKKNDNGVMVYSRKTDQSAIKELKSVVYLKTSLKSLVALIDDWESYPQWVYQCGQSKTLKKNSDTEGMHYQTVTVPWPAHNRDFVVNIKVRQDEKTGIVSIHSTCIPDYIPEVPDHVRVTRLSADWTLVPLKNGTVQVTNQLLVDPGGNIPAWLVNMAATEGPYQTMLHMKDMVMKKKYQEAEIDFIKEAN